MFRISIMRSRFNYLDICFIRFVVFGFYFLFQFLGRYKRSLKSKPTKKESKFVICVRTDAQEELKPIKNRPDPESTKIKFIVWVSWCINFVAKDQVKGIDFVWINLREKPKEVVAAICFFRFRVVLYFIIRFSNRLMVLIMFKEIKGRVFWIFNYSIIFSSRLSFVIIVLGCVWVKKTNSGQSCDYFWAESSLDDELFLGT